MRVITFVFTALVVVSGSLFSQEGTRAAIQGKSGNNWILDKGAVDGVVMGIKGYFWFNQKSGEKYYPMNIARFRVIQVKDKKCQVAVEGIGEGFSEKNFQWATFMHELNPQAPTKDKTNQLIKTEKSIINEELNEKELP